MADLFTLPHLGLVIDPPLAVVTMRDHPGANRMSSSLLRSLPEAIDHAGHLEEVRAVLLEGLPAIFCAGLARDGLLAEDTQQVLDQAWTFVRAPIDCPVPVVASVQGHAMGGGLLLALNADIAVFSERSKYAANFITYGFTPGGGASATIPNAMGTTLAAEMLLTGGGYRGRELKDRGAQILVVGHHDVPNRSRAIALQIAQAPRHPLVLLKRQLAEAVGARSAESHRREMAEHLETIRTAQERIRTTYPADS
jgi:polyketide biosynthesis enoyl-CoA hydratase PksI